MYLFQNKELFSDLVERAAALFETTEEIIEKDYFVSMVLKSIVELEPGVVFKGGTSLSKAFHIINRFSEDIDLSYFSGNHQMIGTAKRKKLTRNIKNCLKKKGFIIQNEEEIKSGYMMNRYEVDYGSLYNRGAVLRPTLLIETYYQFVSFPVKVIEVDSYLYQIAISQNIADLTDDFPELLPFEMNVQTLERTFVDKVFAICDRYLKDEPMRHSRHLYDLYYLYEKGNLDRILLLKIFEEVRALLQTDLKRNPSSKAEIVISEVLRELLKEKFFEEDYQLNTMKLVKDAPEYAVLSQNLLEIFNELNL